MLALVCWETSRPGRLGYWAYGVPWGDISGDLLLEARGPKGSRIYSMRIDRINPNGSDT
jgi:hypothetical protein